MLLRTFLYTFLCEYAFWIILGVYLGVELLDLYLTFWRPQDWKRSVFIPIPKKGNAKECSNYRKIALISHATKVMLKILQARLLQSPSAVIFEPPKISTPKSPLTRRGPPRGTPRVPAPLPLSPFSPPDRDRYGTFWKANWKLFRR